MEDKLLSDYFEVVDSHVHLLDYTNKTLVEVLERAKAARVSHLMSNCCVEGDFEKQDQLIEKYGKDKFIIPSYGLHPWWLQERSENWLIRLKEQLLKYPEGHVGEIGLDSLKYELTSKEEQIEVFEQQLQLAIELDRIVSVHCVRAQPEMLKIFKKYFSNPSGKKINIIMHSYGGNKEMTKQYLKLHTNIFFSLSQGVIKRPEFASVIPLHKVIIETDSPYILCEEEVKSNPLFSTSEFLINDNPSKSDLKKLNEPRFVQVMLGFLSHMHSKPISEIASTILSNSLKALKLSPK